MSLYTHMRFSYFSTWYFVYVSLEFAEACDVFFFYFLNNEFKNGISLLSWNSNSEGLSGIRTGSVSKKWKFWKICVEIQVISRLIGLMKKILQLVLVAWKSGWILQICKIKMLIVMFTLPNSNKLKMFKKLIISEKFPISEFKSQSLTKIFPRCSNRIIIYFCTNFSTHYHLHSFSSLIFHCSPRKSNIHSTQRSHTLRFCCHFHSFFLTPSLKF